jgi:Cytidylyltransferase-like
MERNRRAKQQQLRAVYPGSFNPPTVAHVAIAEAALLQPGIVTVTFALSQNPINKAHLSDTSGRAATLRGALTEYPRFLVEVTGQRLIADIAEGYDLVIVGADKWQQMQDVQYYDFDPSARDAALARLPAVAVVPRSGIEVPESARLGIDEAYRDVSSSEVRAGNLQWLLKSAEWPLAERPPQK